MNLVDTIARREKFHKKYIVNLLHLILLIIDNPNIYHGTTDGIQSLPIDLLKIIRNLLFNEISEIYLKKEVFCGLGKHNMTYELPIYQKNKKFYPYIELIKDGIESKFIVTTKSNDPILYFVPIVSVTNRLIFIINVRVAIISQHLNILHSQ